MQQSSEEIRRLIDSVQLSNREDAKRDIKNAFNNTQSNLILKTGDFDFDDATKKRLLCLVGTIVTKYRGLRYNTPVELWIEETHPYSAPICYVKPTPDMYISSTCSYVQLDGRIVHPYLRNWMATVSSSIMLINELCQAFSDSPPLYSKTPSFQQSSMTIDVSPNHNQSSIVNQSNNLDNDDNLNNRCRICLENDIDCILLECGHLVSCSICAIRFTTCPFCRSPIIRIKRIFRT